MKHTTIKDVAKRLDCSVSTISRAFNDKYDIRKETRDLILATAKEMVAETGIDDIHGVLATTLVALGRIAHEHPEIVEIDVNPLIIYDKATIAVDALVVTSTENGK